VPTKALKHTLRDLLLQSDLEEVAEVALERRRTLGGLVSLTFDPDIQVVWRAVEAMGMAAEALSRESPTFVKEHMRRLYWLITEEAGAVFWRAPECMAELGARMPRLLASHVPIALHLIETLEPEDLEHFRPGALWAVGRLKDVADADQLAGVLPLVEEALAEPDSQARGMAVWSLNELGRRDALLSREELLEDDGPVNVYRDRMVTKTTVGEMVSEALSS
jgi:hypothetical protein